MLGVMDKVYLLHHVRPETNEREEDVKLIGAYSSEAAANAAIQRLKVQLGFRDYPDDFTVEAYEIDKDHWTEGFEFGWT